jgi:hypothetical protein
MHGSSRTTAVMLLITMAAMLDMQALTFPAAHSGHPASCHGPAAPSPAPTSYRCCVNGHHIAIPNPAFSLRAPVRTMDAQLCKMDHGECARLDYVQLAGSALSVASDSPPGIAPLRI